MVVVFVLYKTLNKTERKLKVKGNMKICLMIIFIAGSVLAGVQGFMKSPSSINTLPAVKPYDQLAFFNERPSCERRSFYADLSQKEKMQVWKEQLTRASTARSQDMSPDQRELLEELISKLPEIFLEGKNSKVIEIEIAEAFPEQLRKEIFVELGSGGTPAPASGIGTCDCSYGSSFNACGSCNFQYNYYCGLICVSPAPTGCGFLGQYICDGGCGVKPNKSNCWIWG